MYTFDEIISNDKIKKSLISSIKNNKVQHTYIFDGREKSGKKMIAYTFAKALLCEREGTEPCLECVSCKSFDTKNNPDFFFIKSEKNKMGIAQVKDEIIENTKTKPFKYKYKIFVVDNMQNMTVQAQNSILKTIEEPPEFCIFIFLAKGCSAILPTILSRAILYKIKPISTDIINEYLIKNKKIDEKKAQFYSVYARGSIGVALELIQDTEFIEFRENTTKDIYKLSSLTLISMYEYIQKLEDDKKNIQKILDIYLLTYRDALILKITNDNERIIQKDILYIIRDIYNVSIKNMLEKIQKILDTKKYLEQNANFSMAMECLFLKLKEK